MERINLSDNMSDSDTTDTSDSGSDTSSSCSDQLSLSLEPARILKETLELPKGLCENPSIFQEFFSLDTWQCLPDHMKDQLQPFLPDFGDVCATDAEAQRQTDETVRQLFSNQITRFNASPLADFQRNLEEGNYRPDISRLRDNIQKSHKREQRFQLCERVSRLAKTLAVSRARLLRVAYQSTDLSGIKEEPRANATTKKLSISAAAARAKKRYAEEIGSILEDVGLEDELTDEDSGGERPQVKQPKKAKRANNQVRVRPANDPEDKDFYGSLRENVQ